jgi:hypothetical protein
MRRLRPGESYLRVAFIPVGALSPNFNTTASLSQRMFSKSGPGAFGLRAIQRRDPASKELFTVEFPRAGSSRSVGGQILSMGYWHGTAWLLRFEPTLESLDEKNDPLVAIAAMVAFRSKLKAALIKGELRTSDATRKSLAGSKPWDEVMIFKALVLQAPYMY